MSTLLWLALLGPDAATLADADEFAIELKVTAAGASKTITGQAAAIGVKPRPREVLRVKSKERLRVEWTLTNIDQAKSFKNVLVHFVAVKQERPGQPNVPKLDKGVVNEAALTIDFAPKESARGAITFTLDAPGAYLLRLETIGVAAGAEGQEYFAAVDVVVE